jgi:hypothetical protein
MSLKNLDELLNWARDHQHGIGAFPGTWFELVVFLINIWQ